MNVKNNVSIFKLVAFVLAILLAIFVVFFAFKFGAEKKAINAETRVQNALEDIKVAERSRVDSLQPMADSIKSYSDLEKRVNIQIAQARKNIDSADFEKVNLNIENVLNVIHEAYPNLESSKLYEEYLNTVVTCNRAIEEARKRYNKYLRDYENVLRDPFWSSLIAKTGYEKVEFQKLSETLGDNQDMPQVNWE